MIRKGQAYGSAAGAKVGLLHRFIVRMFGRDLSVSYDRIGDVQRAQKLKLNSYDYRTRPFAFKVATHPPCDRSMWLLGLRAFRDPSSMICPCITCSS